MDYKNATKNIRQELKNYITKNKIKSLVMGISGGIDSALCATLAKPICDELNIPLIGRSLPATSNSGGENTRAKDIGQAFCTDFKETPIQEGFDSMYSIVCENFSNFDEDEHGIKNNILKGNIKARIRMILLYDIAGASNGLVLSTDNYTELLLGFWTLHGDVGDYGMVQNLWKTEVYELSEYLVEKLRKDQLESEASALQACIDCQATDGLGISNSDLDQIMPGWEGSSKDGYKVVDEKLALYVNFGQGDLDDPVLHRYHRTHFKRTNPINIKRDIIEN